MSSRNEELTVHKLKIGGDVSTVLENGGSFVSEASPNIQNWYEQSVTQKYSLGTRMVVRDRVFRYAQAGASDLVAGNLIQAAPSNIVITAANKVFNLLDNATPVALTLTEGSYTITTLLAHLTSIAGTAISPATCAVTYSTTTGKFTFTPSARDTWAYVDTDSTAGDLLGFTADGTPGATMVSDAVPTILSRVELVAGTASAAGVYSAYVTNGATAYAANYFKDGYYCVTKSSSTSLLGRLYKIKSHSAMAANTICQVVLYEPLEQSVAAACEVSLIPSLYKLTIQAPTTPSAMIVGVAPRVVTASYYYWLQTWGPSCVLHADVAAASGTQVLRNVATAGSVTQQVAGNSSVIYESVGYGLLANTAGEGTFVYLTINY